MKIVIYPNQIGLKFIHGAFEKLCETGKYHIVQKTRTVIEVMPLDAEIRSKYIPTENLIEKPDVKPYICENPCRIEDHEIALHFVDGHYRGILECGIHAFWKRSGNHTFEKFNLLTPQICTANGPLLLETYAKLPSRFKKITLKDNQFAEIKWDNECGSDKITAPGVHYIWCGEYGANGISVTVKEKKTVAADKTFTVDHAIEHLVDADGTEFNADFICTCTASKNIEYDSEEGKLPEHEQSLKNALETAVHWHFRHSTLPLSVSTEEAEDRFLTELLSEIKNLSTRFSVSSLRLKSLTVTKKPEPPKTLSALIPESVSFKVEETDPASGEE